MRYRYEPAPHPHIVIDQITDASTYERLRFPDTHILPGASWGLTTSDPGYQDVLADPLWRELHDTLRGQWFVSQVLDALADDMRRASCLVDPHDWQLTDFVESRDEKERAVLASDGNPNELFTRMDFQSKAAGGYREFVHLDWARRIVGGILFFCDADEEGLVGGETALYRDRDFRDDRFCHDAELTALFTPRHNTGIIFLNSNRGFHGPRAITALRGRRRWLYYTISSRVDVWPSRPRPTRTDNPDAA